MAQASFAMWMDDHLPQCDHCKLLFHQLIRDAAKNPVLSEYCGRAQNRWYWSEKKFAGFEPVEQPCICLETRPVEARGPIVGVVYGESGLCLNLEQVKAGEATCLPDAPKEWKKAEALAKKNKVK
jgi:hypothetical protein